MKFLCDQCKAKYQIADDKAAGKTVRMKCRKCGHLIEVRSAVAEPEGAAPAAAAPAAPAGPRAPARPAPPRAAPLATSLASAKKPSERSTGGALAGAFKTSVQREREEETSAPFDMADLSPGDEWYVAINGVPVGPIRVAEIRRKAGLGAVTEESLCWQEGLDEWRPVRAFPELSLVVREAMASGRSSLPPSQTEGRPPPAPTTRSPSARPPAAGPSPSAPRAPVPARPAAAVAVTGPAAGASAALAARSNVVPITSRLATAEKLEESPDDFTRPQTSPLAELPEPAAPAVVADPFANPPAPAPLPGVTGTQTVAALSPTAAAMIAVPDPVLPQRKAPPWMAIAMVAAACAFGVTAGIAVFFRPAAAPAPVAQLPSPTAPTAGGTLAAPTATATATATDTATPEPTTTATTSKGPGVAGGSGGAGGKGPPAPSATATGPAHGPLDLGGVGGSGPRPTDDPGSDNGAKPSGGGITSGQVQAVIGQHQAGIKRACWERSPSTKPAVNISISLTIGGDGSAQSVSATGDDASVAMCVQNDVKGWRFPAMGSSQATAFSLHFVRQ